MTKKYTKEKLQRVIDNHSKWLNGKEGGVRADLKEANLQGVYMEWVDLRWAYLQGANLKGVFFAGVNLEGANLAEVDLQEAELQGVNLQEAYLYEANLKCANLQRVKYNSKTIFPEGFDPKNHGMIEMDKPKKEKTMTKQKNQKLACDRFIENTAKIEKLLDRLHGACDEHFSQNPDTINWGDALFLSDIVSDLQSISDRVFQEGEYASE